METTDPRYNLIVHSGVDAVMLGCVSQLGKITYGEALKQYEARLKAREQFADLVDDIFGA